MTQQSHSWIFTSVKWKCVTGTPACKCLQLLYLYLPQTETTQISITWEIDKQTVIHSHNGVLLSNKKGKKTTNIQQHGLMSKTSSSLKWIKFKKLNIMWFHLCGSLVGAKLQDAARPRWEGRLARKVHTETGVFLQMIGLFYNMADNDYMTVYDYENL